ncbi:MAG: winged helix-turn-helix transcriptional regulator [Pseudomonadales bacterium]|nr:winged helix-turn-helix transcriptional regulator [Pseudomonadales bacterium]MCP5347091.1 winged helix-turn-helix transcriptional regulator [Pseudomonadales bacterium]
MQKVLEAISDPTRRKVLDLLKKKEMSAGELGANFDISGPSMSHHLNKLKAADLVQTTRRGQSIVYSINTSVFEDAAQFVVKFFQDTRATEDAGNDHDGEEQDR